MPPKYSMKAPGLPQAHAPHEFRKTSDEWHMMIGETEYLGYDSELYPFPRDIVRAIRELDPDFTPIRVRTVWRSPSGGTRVFEHHTLSFVTRDPKRKHQNRRVLWPTGPDATNYRRGTFGALVVEDILRQEQTHDVLPGDFRPIGWQDYHRIKAALKVNAESSAPDKWDSPEQRWARGIQEDRERRQRKASEELSYRIDQEAGRLKKAFESVEGSDISTLVVPLKKEHKPFVHVKGAA